MPFETHIVGLSIHELLRVISNAALSGVLTIITPTSSGRIVFTWGRVTHAARDGQERIGEMLVRHGYITEEQLAIALETQTTHRRPRPLGSIITSLGYADAAIVGKLLREQMKFAFFEMMRWTDGTAQLEVDIEVVLASVRLDVSLDTPTLLLEAARRRDEGEGTPAGAEVVVAAGEPIAFLHPFDDSPFEEWQILKSPEETAPAPAPSPPPDAGDRGEPTPPIPA
jgi:hypothetical protein